MVHWAAARALKLRDGLQLGLGGDFWLSWKGKRGARTKETFDKLHEKLQAARTKPHIILLHIGTNDVGTTPFHVIREVIRAGLNDVWRLVPEARIIWSDVIPRRHYASARSAKGADRLRKKLNRFARRWIVHNGGGFISHQISAHDTELFYIRDPVHLSSTGNDILLQEWKEGIRYYSRQWHQRRASGLR